MFGFHANASTKYNRSLLKGHTTFRQLKEQYKNRIEYHKKANDKSVEPEELARIKSEIKVWAQKERRKKSVIFAITMALVFGSMVPIYFMNQSAQLRTQERKALIEQNENSKWALKATYYINDAQDWMSKENYHNANFQYKKAIALIPTHTLANVGAVYSLSQQCVVEEKRCDELESVFLNSYSQAADKDLFKEELYKLGLSSSLQTKDILQALIESVDKKNY